MEKYIIIALILLFGVIYYFDKQHDNTVETLERPSITILEEDKSHCDSILSKDQKIITLFSGYILHYPCTAESHGRIRTYYDDNQNKQHVFQLYFKIHFTTNNQPIWRFDSSDSSSLKKPYMIHFSSNGLPGDFVLTLDNATESKMVKEIKKKGLIIYRDGGARVIAFLNNEKDAIGQPPAMICNFTDRISVDKVFNPIEKFKMKFPPCRAMWMLTEDIRILITEIGIDEAYLFKEIHEAINRDLIEIIIEKPTIIES